jgi:hypothetical protein
MNWIALAGLMGLIAVTVVPYWSIMQNGLVDSARVSVPDDPPSAPDCDLWRAYVATSYDDQAPTVLISRGTVHVVITPPSA